MDLPHKVEKELQLYVLYKAWFRLSKCSRWQLDPYAETKIAKYCDGDHILHGDALRAVEEVIKEIEENE